MEAARTAVESDRPLLIELAERGLVELTPTRGGAVWSRREARTHPVDTSIDRDQHDADTEVVVGTIDGIVFGYGVVRAETLSDGGVLGVVTDLYVQPEARGVGVGEIMMDHVIEWCTLRGCIGVDSMALPGNRETKNFFERFGLTARAIVVHRSLGPVADSDEERQVGAGPRP